MDMAAALLLKKGFWYGQSAKNNILYFLNNTFLGMQAHHTMSRLNPTTYRMRNQVVLHAQQRASVIVFKTDPDHTHSLKVTCQGNHSHEGDRTQQLSCIIARVPGKHFLHTAGQNGQDLAMDQP